MDVPANSPLRASQPVSASEAPSVTWDSPTKPGAVSGKTTLLAVSDTSNGGQCRKVRQAVTRNGQESFEDVQMCKTAGGSWQQVQA